MLLFHVLYPSFSFLESYQVREEELYQIKYRNPGWAQNMQDLQQMYDKQECIMMRNVLDTDICSPDTTRGIYAL